MFIQHNFSTCLKVWNFYSCKENIPLAGLETKNSPLNLFGESNDRIAFPFIFTGIKLMKIELSPRQKFRF